MAARSAKRQRQIENRQRREEERRDEETRRDALLTEARKYPSHFTLTLGPQILRSFGPLVFAEWRLPSGLENLLQGAGRPVPQPISGVMILDTGATKTCISLKVAEDLRLPATRLAECYGASGLTKNKVFAARLTIPIQGDGVAVGTAVSAMILEAEVQSIPDLEKMTEKLQINDRPARCVGLLGRDFLAFSRLSYDGVKGQIRVDIDDGALIASGSTKRVKPKS